MTTHTLLPKGAVAVVILWNRHRNLYGNIAGSGPVYLMADGRVLIDGLVTAPGDVLWPVPGTDDRLVRELPDEVVEVIGEKIRGRIESLTELSLRINRGVARTSPVWTRDTDTPVDDPFDLDKMPVHSLGFEPVDLGPLDFDPMDCPLDFSSWDEPPSPREPWRDARYPADADDYASQNTMEWLDGLSDQHDPEAIKRAAVIEDLDRHYRFVVGGHLHVETDTLLSRAARAAVLAYQALGGRLGATVAPSFRAAADTTGDSARPKGRDGPAPR